MIDAIRIVGVRVLGDDVEAERLLQEGDRGFGIAVAEGGPDVGMVLGHGHS